MEPAEGTTLSRVLGSTYARDADGSAGAAHKNGSFSASAAADLKPFWSRPVERSEKTFPIAHPPAMRSGSTRCVYVPSEARASRGQKLELN